MLQSGMFAIALTHVHSVACVLNDLADIDLDRQVERTKDRPLASGRIKASNAAVFLFILTLSCCIGLSFGNRNAVLAGAFGLFPLHALYPFLKRWTWWPQVWLGFTVGWGFPFAWLWISPEISANDLRLILVMLLANVCWALVYDTQYGCQDRRDDRKAGAKSTALFFGNYIREISSIFAFGVVGCLILIGLLNDFTARYFMVSCLGASLHFTWQMTTWKVDNASDCAAKFQSNGHLGYLIWAGLLLEYFKTARLSV